LKQADDAVLADQNEHARSTAGPELAEVIRGVVESGKRVEEPAGLTVDYPLDESIFPPEMVPPTFLWHEDSDQADTWLIDVVFGGKAGRICVLCPGTPPSVGRIDPRAVSKSNEIYRLTPYQASARSWTPSGDLWATIKARSAEHAATVTILGFRGAQPAKVLSRGRITITTSEDPVVAPIFYRDVPLAPAITQEGVIKPLRDDAVSLIAWRLRDISKPDSRLLLTDVPTCTNCHSFSSDGKTLGMDLDGPQGDKGAYVIAPTAKNLVIEENDVISWNAFRGKPEDHKTIGFLSQISPDGQYAVTTVNEAVYVQNFMDYRFLQVFFPTRGILAFYSRRTGQIKALPGADDPKYVHCDAVWSPDGEQLVFARAEAKDPYPGDGKHAKHAGDPTETQVQYDLYRIPFNEGRGGEPEPIAGASNNGMSNTFPKTSPDGKWIVFVQCRNGQLMRPDSKLWIVPASGGTARLMKCNTSLMNSWHSFSPNGRWMVFSSKCNTPYTEMFLTHLDERGNDSPAILIPNSTAANRAVNIPEFINVAYDDLVSITMPAIEYRRDFVRGVQLAGQGQLDEALAQFDRALEARPDFPDGRIAVADVLCQKGMPDEAAAYLTEMLTLDPEHAEAQYRLAVLLERKGMLDEAVSRYRTTLELDSAHVDAHTKLARILWSQGKIEEAARQFRALLKVNAEDPYNHFDLACILFKKGMFREAEEHFKESLELRPRFAEARRMLGNTLAAQGKHAAAVAQLQQATETEPENLSAVNDLARLLAACPTEDVRDGAEAIRLIEPACKSTGYRHPVLLDTLAAAYAEEGRFTEAVAIATRALDRVKPQDKLRAHSIRIQLERYQDGKPCRDLQIGLLQSRIGPGNIE
jgi:tetratricopeptide (TPR) repeat protein